MKLRVIQGFRDPSGKYRKKDDEAKYVGPTVLDSLGREMVMVEFEDGQRCYVFPHEHKAVGESEASH